MLCSAAEQKALTALPGPCATERVHCEADYMYQCPMTSSYPFELAALWRISFGSWCARSSAQVLPQQSVAPLLQAKSQ